MAVHDRLGIAKSMSELSHWGWGRTEDIPTGEHLRKQAADLVATLGFGSAEAEQAVPLQELQLPRSRLEVPAQLSQLCSTRVYDRATHTFGKSYRDVIR